MGSEKWDIPPRLPAVAEDCKVAFCVLDRVPSTFKLEMWNAITRVLQELFSVAFITQIGMCKTSPIIFYCCTVNVLL